MVRRSSQTVAMALMLASLPVAGCYVGGAFGPSDEDKPDTPESDDENEGEGEDEEGEGEDESPPGRLPGDSNPLYSVVARLTNAEYYAAVSDLLELSDEQQALLAHNEELANELEQGGLVSAVERQQLNQLVFSRFASVAEEAVRLRLGGDLLTPEEVEAGMEQEALTLDNFNERVGCSDPSVPSTACIADAAATLLERGFRGKQTAADSDAIAEIFAAFEDDIDTLSIGSPTDEDEIALARLTLRYVSAVQYIALSPKFASLPEFGLPDEQQDFQRPLTEQEIANRVAFFITGAPPDDQLQSAVAEGALSDPESRRLQASRLTADPVSIVGAEEIIARWLGLDPELATEDQIAAAREFLNTWLLERRPFSDLYTAEVAVPNPGGAVVMRPFGALGLQAVVASHTSAPTPSFINRGEFIVADLLCGQLPDDVPDDAVNGDATTPLEVFQEHAMNECATCHHIFDNYGAAMQQFQDDDARYNEAQKPLGDSFELFPIGDVNTTVSDVGELSAVIGASRQAHTCFATLWYRHAMRRDTIAEDAPVVEAIVDEWLDGDTSVASLLELIVSHEDFAILYL